VGGPSGGTVVALGTSQTFNVPNGQVVITVNDPTVTEGSNGQNASGAVDVVTADIRVGPSGPSAPTARAKLLPLKVSAAVPAGGIDCVPPAPVLNQPANNSTTADTTPTFTGTARPNANVDIFIDGNAIGTTPADNAGDFSFTPNTPLTSGVHLATARQTTEGGTSQPSAANNVTIVGPPVLQNPADGSATNDTTPTFTGTTLPGAQVDVLVDGNPIGTATANSAGGFSFTPTTALTPGDHQYRAKATLNGATSGLSNVHDFAVDLAAPAAPTLNRPADGSVTRDTTPTFIGTAEPGADVEIFVDGNSIGGTTANGNGDFSFTPTAPLAAGPHEAFVGATDPAGNDSPQSNTNGFRIDIEDPDAPGITSPGEGSTTTDTTPTITGSAEPGGRVIVYVDGEAVGSTTADGNGKFSFTLPHALSLGDHEVRAVAVDEAGNRSAASDPLSFEVLAAEANAGGQNNQLGQTGGPQGWLPVAGALGLLVGGSILLLARWRRRSSQA
jgi:LPXTG-motif cell wall-anchored protein